MLNVQLFQYLLKESQTALHTDGKRVYMLKDEGFSPYPIYLTYYPKEVSFLRRVKDDSLAAGGR
ncbi:hypothetical protein [Bacillus cereus group sp. N28]|uniref:hypothetical protein n=1 Tax=Bacillus cereus group sp. N28 TaxID=2794593 RepID=UPI001F5B8B2B|nr:hypothetical protein [Bacillus cereus group sp. N28]